MGVARQLVELLFELFDPACERVLAPAEPLFFGGAIAALSQSRDFVLHRLLFAGEFFRALGRLLHTTRRLLAARLLQHPARLVQPILRRAAAPRSQLSVRGGGPPHLIGGVLQRLGRLLHLGRLLLTRQPFETPRQFFGLLCHLALRPSTTSAGAPRLGTLPRPLVGLLLASGEPLETLERLVDIARRLLLGAVLHLLVLVAELVRLELEEVGEVFGARIPATATAAAVLHADLHFLEQRVDALQQLQRALFGCQRFAQLAGGEELLGGTHLGRHLGHQLGHHPKRGVGSLHGRTLHARGGLLHLTAQLSLRQVDGGDVVAELGGLTRRLVAVGLERGCDDLPLARHERARILLALSSSPAPTGLVLLVLAIEATNGEEVDVCRGALGARHRVVVPHLHVVRDHVARLQSHLLQEDGVAGGEFTRPTPLAV